MKSLSNAEVNKRPLGNGMITDEEKNSPGYKKWKKESALKNKIAQKMSRDSGKGWRPPSMGKFTGSGYKSSLSPSDPGYTPMNKKQLSAAKKENESRLAKLRNK